MSNTTTETTHSTHANRLRERLKNTTVEDLKGSLEDEYDVGARVAANELSIDELRDIDLFFTENVDGVPVNELEEDDVFNGLVNAVGIDRARELLDYGNQPISGASKLGVFLLGIVETWREADV